MSISWSTMKQKVRVCTVCTYCSQFVLLNEDISTCCNCTPLSPVHSTIAYDLLSAPNNYLYVNIKYMSMSFMDGSLVSVYCLLDPW